MMGVIRKIGIVLGFVGAVGVGVLGGVSVAFFMPFFKLLFGVSVALATIFVNTATYYYIVIHKPALKQKMHSAGALRVTPGDTWQSVVFLTFGAILTAIAGFAFFMNMYIGFTFVAAALPFAIPQIVLLALGIFFGTVVSISSVISNGVALYDIAEQIAQHFIQPFLESSSSLAASVSISSRGSSPNIKVRAEIQSRETAVEEYAGKESERSQLSLSGVSLD